MSTSSWRVGLRVARRSALRTKGRTLLIVAMIGLPITGLVAADTLFRTAELTPEQSLTRMLGQADFVVADTATGLGEFGWAGAVQTEEGTAERPGLNHVLETGAASVPFARGSTTFVSTFSDAEFAELHVTDLNSPLLDGVLAQRTGRAPVAPDEAVVTPAFLTSADTTVGGTATIGEKTVRIVGAAVEPAHTTSVGVYVAPGSVLAKPDPDQSLSGTLLGTTPEATEAEITAALSESGLAWTSRDQLLAALQYEADMVPDNEDLGTAVVVVGLAGLQIVLLAGAAFAVGARRQRRDFGLVMAQGGDRRHVRGMVLSSALVTGLVASVVGVVLGIAVAAIARQPIESAASELFGPFETALADLAVIVAIGLGTALLAAALPARTAARTPVLSALTGRRGVTRTPGWVTVLALVAVVTGFVVASTGARPPADYNVILAGAVIAELGFALCAPAIVGLCGRAARWFPLTLRLAFRDSARNRGRSAPAIAAVMAALAATVGLSVFLVSDDQRAEDQYVRSLPPNVAQAFGMFIGDEQSNNFADPKWSPTAQSIADAIPGTHTVALKTLGSCDDQGMCTYVSASLVGPEFYGSEVAVGDAGTVADLTGSPATEESAAALADGRAVVLTDRPVDSIEVGVEAIGGMDKMRRTRVAAVSAGTQVAANMPVAVVPQEFADALGAGVRHDRQLWIADHALTDDDMRAAKDALDASGFRGVVIERDEGYKSDTGILLLALVGISTLVTVGATVIATGLARIESRPDLATLAAVGASPRIRRTLAMAQAASIALTGAVLGVFAGLIPAYAVLDARVDYPFVIPWGVVTLVVVAVPTLAALLAGLFTRSRLPMNARIE